MAFLRNVARKIKNKLVGRNSQVIADNCNQIVVLKGELECLKKDFSASQVFIKELLIKQNQKKINVIFFFQQATLWNNFKSVYYQMLNDERFDCKVIVCPFLHDRKNYENKEGIAFLTNENVSFEVFDSERFEFSSVDVAFLQTPYDCTRPDALSTPSLINKGIKVAYIPYGLDVGGGADNLRWQYDLDCQNLSQWVFVRSEKHKQFYGKYCSKGNNHVYVTGHPKFDQVDYNNSKVVQNDDDRMVFLWTPHFSINDGGWSTFDKFSNLILDKAKEGNFDLIIRPHPLFVSRLESCSDDLKKKYAEMLKIVNDYSNITLDPADGSYIDSFLKSNVLIADAGSFLLEYLPSKKPIIYLHNVDGPGLNESGGFSKYLYTASTEDDVISYINLISNGDDFMREERIAIIPEEVHISEFSAAQEICGVILKSYNIY